MSYAPALRTQLHLAYVHHFPVQLRESFSLTASFHPHHVLGGPLHDPHVLLTQIYGMEKSNHFPASFGREPFCTPTSDLRAKPRLQMASTNATASHENAPHSSHLDAQTERLRNYSFKLPSPQEEDIPLDDFGEKNRTSHRPSNAYISIDKELLAEHSQGRGYQPQPTLTRYSLPPKSRSSFTNNSSKRTINGR